MMPFLLEFYQLIYLSSELSATSFFFQVSVCSQPDTIKLSGLGVKNDGCGRNKDPEHIYTETFIDSQEKKEGNFLFHFPWPIDWWCDREGWNQLKDTLSEFIWTALAFGIFLCHCHQKESTGRLRRLSFQCSEFKVSIDSFWPHARRRPEMRAEKFLVLKTDVLLQDTRGCSSGRAHLESPKAVKSKKNQDLSDLHVVFLGFPWKSDSVLSLT